MPRCACACLAVVGLRCAHGQQELPFVHAFVLWRCLYCVLMFFALGSNRGGAGCPHNVGDA